MPEVTIKSPLFMEFSAVMFCITARFLSHRLPLPHKIPQSPLSLSITDTFVCGERIVVTALLDLSALLIHPTSPFSVMTVSFTFMPDEVPALIVKP